MRIVRADPSDRATTAACFEIVRAADAVDDPDGPPWSLTRLRGWLEYPTEPAETWICPDAATGAVAGWYYLILPERENRDRAYMYLTVRPSSRRGRIGTALLRHAAERSAACGRSMLGSGVFQGSAGAAFAARVGATAGLVEARRVLVLGKIPAGRVAQLREQATRAAARYSCGVRPSQRTSEYPAGVPGEVRRGGERDGGRAARRRRGALGVGRGPGPAADR